MLGTADPCDSVEQREGTQGGPVFRMVTSSDEGQSELQPKLLIYLVYGRYGLYSN